MIYFKSPLSRMTSACAADMKKNDLRAVENTVTTDAKGREGGGFDRNVITTLSLQCGI